MTRTNGEVVSFTFQEIPMEEARHVVLAGDGNYSEVKQMLLERLPELAPDKAFAFGLPDGREVPEDKRRGLCMAINATLKRAGLSWRITYSGMKKLFICIPETLKRHSDKQMTHGRIDTSNDQKIFALRAEGFTVPQIARQVPTSYGRIRYLCYSAFPKKDHLTPKPERVQVTNFKDPLRKELSYTPERLVQTARRIFQYSGDFKGGGNSVLRKAISVVGVKDLGLAPKALAALIGISRQGVYFNVNLAKSSLGAMEIEALRKAVLTR